MIGTILSVFGTISALLSLVAIGAGVGGLSWVSARMIPGLSGLIASCVVGGMVVVGTGGAGFIKASDQCANQAKLNEERFARDRVQQELDASKAAGAVQDEVVKEMAATIHENQAAFARLDSVIAAHGTTDGCEIFADEWDIILNDLN